jgi:hypothetical protein
VAPKKCSSPHNCPKKDEFDVCITISGVYLLEQSGRQFIIGPTEGPITPSSCSSTENICKVTIWICPPSLDFYDSCMIPESGACIKKKVWKPCIGPVTCIAVCPWAASTPLRVKKGLQVVTRIPCLKIRLSPCCFPRKTQNCIPPTAC